MVIGAKPKLRSAYMNDRVWVRLNDHGWATFDAFHRDLGVDPAEYRAILDRDGIGAQGFQLWELFEIFGPATSIGRGPHFEFAEIFFEKPDPERAL